MSCVSHRRLSSKVTLDRHMMCMALEFMGKTSGDVNICKYEQLINRYCCVRTNRKTIIMLHLVDVFDSAGIL